MSGPILVRAGSGSVLGSGPGPVLGSGPGPVSGLVPGLVLVWSGSGSRSGREPVAVFTSAVAGARRRAGRLQ